MNAKGYRRRSAKEVKRQRRRPATYVTTNNTMQIESRNGDQRPNWSLLATNKIVILANLDKSSDYRTSLSLFVSLEASFTSGHLSSPPPFLHSANDRPCPDAKMTMVLLDRLTHHREIKDPATNPGVQELLLIILRAAVTSFAPRALTVVSPGRVPLFERRLGVLKWRSTLNAPPGAPSALSP